MLKSKQYIEDYENNNKPLSKDDDKHHRVDDNDKFHVGLLFRCLVLSYLLNFAYGFQAYDKAYTGTTMYGVVFTIGLLVWLVVALVDYFRED